MTAQKPQVNGIRCDVTVFDPDGLPANRATRQARARIVLSGFPWHYAGKEDLTYLRGRLDETIELMADEKFNPMYDPTSSENEPE